jgi:hypothetical protein
MATRNELIQVLHEQYQQARRAEKSQILDAFIAITGYHRKHAIRVLNAQEAPRTPRTGRRVYDEAVREALIVLWETADRICGKRLKALLPTLIPAMEAHGHLHLDDTVRQRLLTVSAATIDRLLAPVRQKARPGRKRRRARGTAVGRQVPIRTAADWDNPRPGYFEMDFVVHCGGSMAGRFIHSLVVTDIASGWTDCLPLLVREQTLVVEALEQFRHHLPVPILGLDTDNDSAFINETLFTYCQNRTIEQTRSRPRRKNDQAWIEQKNGAVVRRLVGYHRYAGVEACQLLARLFGAARLYVNFFQPSFKLKEKIRRGARVTKHYHPPATPCARLLAHPQVEEATKQKLRDRQAALDPVALLKSLRDTQAALVALHQPPLAGTDSAREETLTTFLNHLPDLWRAGEARPTHRAPPKSPRTWRTRADPFAAEWPTVLEWLGAEPDTTAKDLFERLCREQPGKFRPGQLRTLQRRVQAWRQTQARALIRMCSPSSQPALSRPPEKTDAPSDAAA